MTTATREPPNLQGPCPGAERMVWPVQTHPAQSTGPESKRNSGDGGYFSLDFSFYRLRYKWAAGFKMRRQRRHFYAASRSRSGEGFDNNDLGVAVAAVPDASPC